MAVGLSPAIGTAVHHVLTGVTAFLVVDAVGNRHYDASWFGLVLIAVVLFAGIDSACALRRELVAAKPEGRPF